MTLRTRRDSVCWNIYIVTSSHHCLSIPLHTCHPSAYMSHQPLHILYIIRSYLRHLFSFLSQPFLTALPPTQIYFDEPEYDFSNRIPEGAWDSHMHVTLPGYSLATDAEYIPKVHTVNDAVMFEKTINISNVVLVQPSIYGTDNSCLLHALKAIGPRHARGVVCIDQRQSI